MSKIPQPPTPPPAPQAPNTLNLSKQDFDNLVAVISDSIHVPMKHQNTAGQRFVTVTIYRNGKRVGHDIQLPDALQSLSDKDPRVVSWAAGEALAVHYKPQVYRKTTTDLQLENRIGGEISFRSHTHDGIR
jgi:hypothetical protein